MKSKVIFRWENGWGERKAGNTTSSVKSLQADRMGEWPRMQTPSGAAKWELQLKHQDQ